MEQTIFEELGIEYIEKNSLLYPNINMPEDVAIGNVGRYGLLWISYMKENHINRFRLLTRLGRLNTIAMEVDEEAYQMLDVITKRYLQKYLPENRSSTMEIWKVREQARMNAEETIFTDIIYRFR